MSKATTTLDANLDVGARYYLDGRPGATTPTSGSPARRPESNYSKPPQPNSSSGDSPSGTPKNGSCYTGLDTSPATWHHALMSETTYRKTTTPTVQHCDLCASPTDGQTHEDYTL